MQRQPNFIQGEFHVQSPITDHQSYGSHLTLAFSLLLIQVLFCFSNLVATAQWATLTNPVAFVNKAKFPLPLPPPQTHLDFDPNQEIGVESTAQATNVFQTPIHVIFELQITTTTTNGLVVLRSDRKQEYLLPGQSVTFPMVTLGYPVGANPLTQYKGTINIYGLDSTVPQLPVLIVGQSVSVCFRLN
jgi:hypothetical protein